MVPAIACRKEKEVLIETLENAAAKTICSFAQATVNLIGSAIMTQKREVQEGGIRKGMAVSFATTRILGSATFYCPTFCVLEHMVNIVELKVRARRSRAQDSS